MNNKLKTYAKDNNNAAIIKFILAYLVIFSHAFPITLGQAYVDPMDKLTNGQLNLGNFSVCIFLLFSGYFITGSLERSKSAKDFFTKRIKRIFPPLIIVLLLTVFVIGPIFTTVSLKQYFMDSSPYLYLIKNTFLLTTHNIIGLWSNNPYPYSPNGALWTLPIEFLCYIGGYIAYKLNLINKKNLKFTLIPFLILFIFQSIIYQYIKPLEVVLPMCMLFYMGMIYYIYSDKIIINDFIAILAMVLSILSIYMNMFFYFKILLLPYIFMWLAFRFKSLNHDKKWYNVFKLSYEIYLLGFAIQQVITYIGKINNPYINFGLTLIPVLILAYILNWLTNLVVRKVSI